jgi:hypothetical protein
MLHAEGLLAKATTGKLPESWVRAGPLRRLLRTSEGNRAAIPARTEKVSKKGRKSARVEFDHRRVRSEHEESGSVSFYETRGVRDSSETFLFSDFQETFSLANYTGHAEAEIYASFFEAANYWLKEVGEKDFFKIVDDADKAKESVNTRKQQNKIDRFVFQRWWFEIGMKHGFLSPPAVAAKFLVASDFVHRLSKGNQQLQRAIYQFADAWHWMHFEGKGEHELADIGFKSVQGRSKGPAAKAERAALKKRIIKDCYENFAADEKNGIARTHAKSAAGALKDEVNSRLKDLGIKAAAEKSLTDELRPLINERFSLSMKNKKR